MGIYRYILATLVVVSHCGGTVAGRNPGVAAVISFYMISGFVMTALVHRHYGERRLVGLFYVDRLARLVPQYGFYLLITALLLSTSLINPAWLSDMT